MFEKLKARQALVLVVLAALLVPLTVQAQDDNEESEGYPEGTSISLLQWSHFVPRYDEWFDEYATNWGEENGVGVSVDHINLADLPASLAAAIDAGEGPTIVELLFSPAAFIEGLHDLSDINMQVQEMLGEQAPTCTATSYLPATDTWYAFTHGYVPDPGDYDVALWSEVGFPEGPRTWDDLLEGGAAIREQLGVPLGIGMSPELDSEMAARALIWSFGGSVQDENENVVLNSPETVEAVEFMVELYNETMTEEVFGWTAASNNQGLIAGSLSYILNSISAYRSLQKIDEEAADNIGFVPALEGPGGQYASSHVWQIYVIPTYVEGAELEAAKQFIVDHTMNYSDAVFNSELYNFPCFPEAVPELDGWLEEDPFGSNPADKLTVLAGAADWGVHLGYPGVANPAISQVFNEYIISGMMARAALGEVTPEQAVAEAHERVEEIFATWRERGLVGGGDAEE